MRSVAIGLAVAVGITSSGLAAEAPEVDAEALIERCWATGREDLDTDSALRIGQASVRGCPR